MRIFGKIIRKFRFERSGRVEHKFFVRICRRKTELLTIVNEAVSLTTPWSEDLVDRVLKFVIDGQDENSVFGSETDDPLDPGHALAVIAEGIAQKNFTKRRKKGCARCTLFLDVESVSPFFSRRKTPENNVDFYPADNLHYDLFPIRPKDFANWFLESIKAGTVRPVFLSNNEGTYCTQARIAYSKCLERFGKLSEIDSATEWPDGKTLTTSEQIGNLEFLANTSIFYSSPSQK